MMTFISALSSFFVCRSTFHPFLMIFFPSFASFSFISTNTHSQSAEMMNFFLTPNDMKYDNNNNMKTMQTATTKIPQNVVSDKETFNDRTRKSLFKINLFIKRLKWFNIFTTETTATESKTSNNNQQQSKVQKVTEIQKQQQEQQEQQKW